MDNSKNKPASVIVGNCLACEGLVRIPASAKTNTQVRCPHCAQSFPLQQILDNSIPELEILPGEEPKIPEIIPHADRVSVADRIPTIDIDEKPREKYIVPRQLTLGAKRKRRHKRRDNSSSSKGGRSSMEPVDNRPYREQKIPPQPLIGDSETTPTPAEDAMHAMETGFESSNPASTSQRPRVTPSSNSSGNRPRHSSKTSSRSSSRTSATNPMVEILKVVIGGALAFPIAYLMLFWVFGQDPLKIGPSLGKVVPFVVPAEFRENNDVKAIPQAAKSTKKAKSQTDNQNSDDGSSGTLTIPDFDPDKIGVENVESLLD